MAALKKCLFLARSCLGGCLCSAPETVPKMQREAARKARFELAAAGASRTLWARSRPARVKGVQFEDMPGSNHPPRATR